MDKLLFKDDREYFNIEKRKVHLTLWLSVFFVLVMLVWAYFAVLDEVTTAEGKVIPSQKIQVLDNLEGGVVKEILVNEGDRVKKGQVLVRLDNIKYSSDYNEEKIKGVALKIKLERLTAMANGKSFSIPEELAQKFPQLVQSENALYFSQQNELRSLQSKRGAIVRQIEMTRPVLRSGAVSEAELLQLQQGLYEVDSVIGKFKSMVLQELNATKAEVSRIDEGARSFADQLERTEIRSPVNGIVKQLYVNTVGGAVKPQTPIAEVVPLADTLRIEARVKPKDIGFLHLGEKAKIKVSAFDYSIYGGLEGKVEHLSADTSVDDKGNSYYEIWIRTDRNYLIDKHGQKLEIIPGMQVTTDILTGQKSVLEYLLKPILKARQTALRER